LTLDAPEAEFLSEIPLRVVALGNGIIGKRDRALFVRYGFSSAYISWLRDNARKYDGVIVHGLWNFATMAAAIVLPSIMRGKYYVYPHGMMDPWFAKHDPRKHFLKQISWLGLEGRLLAGARAVLFTAPEEKSLADGQFWGWSYNGVVVGYGISEPPLVSVEDRRCFRDSISGLGDRKFLLFLSRIHPKKGCDLLVKAFAAVGANEGVDIVIAGPDEVNIIPELKAIATQLGIGERIHWPGMLRGSSKWAAYYEAEAFVLPSHQENFGIVVAEALACGVPVLTTDKVNIWRSVADGGGGIVRVDDEEGVADLLTTWFAMPEAERRNMSVAARRIFDEQFSVRYVARNFLNLLNEHGIEGAAEVVGAMDFEEVDIADVGCEGGVI